MIPYSNSFGNLNNLNGKNIVRCRLFSNPNISCDLNTLNINTTEFQMSATNTSGDISHLVSMSNLNILDLMGLRELTGSINSLSPLINLTSIVISYTTIGGSLEDFAQGQVDAGRVSGSVVVKAGSSYVTYEGHNLPEGDLHTITYNGSGYSIT